VSNHSRALAAATSGLFWWSATSTSIFLPATVPPDVGDRHLDRFRAGRAVDVGVEAREVADEADLDDVARELRLRQPGTMPNTGGGGDRRRRYELLNIIDVSCE
jgi:hypothetical protein